MSDLPDLSKMRGMSEPFSFAFTADPKTKILTSHTVIFASFVMSNEQSANILDKDSDPRAAHFIHFVWSNWLKERRKHLEEKLSEAEALIAEDKKKIEELDRKIKEKEQLKQ